MSRSGRHMMSTNLAKQENTFSVFNNKSLHLYLNVDYHKIYSRLVNFKYCETLLQIVKKTLNGVLFETT